MGKGTTVEDHLRLTRESPIIGPEVVPESPRTEAHLLGGRPVSKGFYDGNGVTNGFHLLAPRTGRPGGRGLRP